MGKYDNERLLIISNNVLSNTRNNGKTIYSYIDSLPEENVAQLYFNGERPSIPGYNYFQISDKDILRGLISSKKRGRSAVAETSAQHIAIAESSKRKGAFARVLREALWRNRWQSKQLWAWLDAFAPTAVFFVGGDCCFAYDICQKIVERYGIGFSVYITDDYIMPRSKESFIEKRRRLAIKKKMQACVSKASAFFTVSEMMRREYQTVLSRDSSVIVNLTESLKKDAEFPENEKLELVYAGSFYYGRDRMLGKLAEAIAAHNVCHEKKAFLKIYSNSAPDAASEKSMIVEGASKYLGSLNKDALMDELNRSDVLVFVESFDKEQMEKTKYSLSTKVPEYMSVEKPILAIGPQGIGSMDYLSDVALCVNDVNALTPALERVLTSEEERRALAEKARAKYVKRHDKVALQRNFLSAIFDLR